MAAVANAQNISEFTLKNGMRVVVVPDHRAPVVTHFVWYGVGSVDEVPGKTGIAHFLEHLMFKGTEKVAPGEISKILAQMGGEDNAFTSYDLTAYYMKIAKANLEKVMSLEADRMQNLRLLEKDVNTERNVIIEERRMRTDSQPVARFVEKLNRTHYGEHKYGNPVIGWLKDMQGLTREDALKWYKDYYNPSHAMLLLVGDIEQPEASKLADKYYGDIPARPVEVPPMAIEPKWDTPRELVVRDADVNVPFVYRLYRAPSFFSGVAGQKPDEREVWALTLLADILGGNTSSPLYKRLVVEQGLADVAQTDFNGVGRGETTFGVYLQPKQGVSVEKLLAAYDQALKDFAVHDLDKAMLKRAQMRQKANDVYERDDTMGYGTRLGWWLTLGGTIESFNNALRDIDAVTLDDIKDVMRKYLNLKTSTTGILLPVENKAEAQ